jgi:amino acid adenylation domain-containing protein
LSDLLQDFVGTQVQRRGEAPALRMGHQRFTYAELESASNRLARLLIRVGVRRGDRVCLLAPKSCEAIIGMLGVLKAGGAYVPIDTVSPVARAARIVEAAQPAAALVLEPAADLTAELLNAGALDAKVPVGALAGEIPGGSRLAYSFGPAEIASEHSDAPPRVGAPQDPAHLLFTSGSTGQPKGVVITHANVIPFLRWALAYFEMRPTDRVSGHPPLHFDLSTFDIYGTFGAGAELHLVPPSVFLPAHFAEFISANRLTQWFSVPSAMTYMAKFGAVPDDGFPSLERVLWCGEVLPTAVLVHWMKRVPQARFTNLYGPTETTIASSHYTLPAIPSDESKPIPIGTACEGEELAMFDERGKLAAEGEVGEIYIGGAGVSPGYWRDSQKTADAFVPDPRPHRGSQRLYRTGDLGCRSADGLIYFLGRKDSQIKSRGYRIELGEIEAALNAVPEVAECAVVGIESDGFEGTSICCAFASAAGTRVMPVHLRAALGASLPVYMLPSRWKMMDALPKNVNGKIDRRGLREMFSQEPPTATSAEGLVPAKD